MLLRRSLASSILGLAVVAMVAAGPAASAAKPSRLDASTRAARALFRDAAPEVQRAMMKRGPGMRALARLIEDARIPRKDLVRLLANRAAAPYVEQALVDMVSAQHALGARQSFHALARQTGSVQGYAFEIRIAALLGHHIARSGFILNGREVDGELNDGTMLELKTDGGLGAQDKIVKQVGSSTAGWRSGLVIGDGPFDEAPERIGAHPEWDDALPGGAQRIAVLRRRLADRFGDDVAVAYTSGGKIVVQVPSRHFGAGDVIAALDARHPVARPHTPSSKRARQRVARQARRAAR